MISDRTPGAPAQKHLPFNAGFIWVALALALFAGFGIGAHMAFILGYRMALHPGFQTYIQLHGHVQLVGWAGLFVMGVSLHFLPRLASEPIRSRRWPQFILGCMAAGLVLRTLSHSILPYARASIFFAHLNWLGAISGLLELAGIFTYLGALIYTLLDVAGRASAPFRAIRPFFLMQVAGWSTYALINAFMLIEMARLGETILPPQMDVFSTHLFLGLVLLPVAFAFSAKTFPLYFRRRPLDWPVKPVAAAYFLGLCVQILPASPLWPDAGSHIAPLLSSAGAAVKSAAILMLIWQLNILTRFRKPWTEEMAVPPVPHRRLPRKNMPDYGEFGRFERPVYAAYVSLALAAIAEGLFALAEIKGLSFPKKDDLLRHLYLLGFITQLIFGMSVRMIPGFVHRRRIASCRLVDATFWLGSTAVVLRVLPDILALPVLAAFETGQRFAGYAYAWSGTLAMFAVACLAVNIWKTVKGKRKGGAVSGT